MPTIICPQCNQEYELDESIIGCSVQCAVCNTKFIAQPSNDAEDKDIKGNDTQRDNTSSLFCQNCKKENKPGTVFCIFCGKKIDVSASCPFCHATLVQGATFCSNCGKKVTDYDSQDAVEPETASLETDKQTIPSRETISNYAAELKTKFMSMSKKKRIVIVSAFLLAILFLIILIGSGSGETNNDKITTNQPVSGGYYPGNQSDADMAALLFLMGAAAAQQQQQQNNNYSSQSNVIQVVCTECGGLGYVESRAFPHIREHCSDCGGTGYVLKSGKRW